MKELENGIRQKEEIILKLTSAESGRNQAAALTMTKSSDIEGTERIKQIEGEVQAIRRRLQQLLSSSSGDVTERKECELLLKAKQAELEEAKRSVALLSQMSTGSTRTSIGSFEEGESIRKELMSMQSGKLRITIHIVCMLYKQLFNSFCCLPCVYRASKIIRANNRRRTEAPEVLGKLISTSEQIQKEVTGVGEGYQST